MSIWLKNQPWNSVDMTRSEVANEIEWNLWQTRQSPYFDLDIGDTIFLAMGGDGQKSKVTWEVRVTHVVREEYESFAHAARILTKAFGSKAEDVFEDAAEFRRLNYHKDRPSSGWLLGFAYEPVRKIEPPVPRLPKLRVRQNGWADLTDLTDAQLRKLGLIPGDWTGKRLPRTRAGRMSDSARRIAVELHAMNEAKKFLQREKGYKASQIVDTSANKPYDYECFHAKRPVLRVEVKGTTGPGTSIRVSRGEVDNARDGDVPTALLICHDIELTTRNVDEPIATGGEINWIEEWKPKPSRLHADSYTYDVQG